MQDLQFLLEPEIQEFINKHLEKEVVQLALQKNPFPNQNYTEVLQQIAAKQKAKDKLPTWFCAKDILFPSKISVEQTSSEIAANYKANLVSGEILIDATGGFGIDDFYFAKTVKKVVHCEINEKLSEIVQHNATILEVANISFFTGDSAVFLDQNKPKADWIYIDPSRRNDAKEKVFLLQDCLPNVPELLPFYFSFTKNILLKTAPILDIQAGINALQFVKKIHIVAIANEVKEVLWELESGYSQTIAIESVNIEKRFTQQTTTYFQKEEIATFSLPKKYIYEPNAALLKSGNFNAISAIFGVEKLHSHSHLYTSDSAIDFPGRKFIINKIVPFQKSEISRYISNQKMNVSTRNFPLQPDAIKKKYKISDGGLVYAFFTTTINNEKIVLLCTKMD